MPRPVRVHIEGAVSYVTSRAMDGLILFRDQKDYEAYYAIVQEYKRQYGFKLFAALLLPGELHLAIEPSPAASISTIMHAITSRYTKRYGKRYGHTGHLFQSRFKLTLMEKAPSLLRLTGYLHALPQRCGASDDVEMYRWSSLSDYFGDASGARHPAQSGQTGGVSGTGIVWCSGDEVAEVLGQLQAVRPGWTYALYFRSLTAEDLDRCEPEFQRPVVGSDSFRASVEQKRKAAAKTAELRLETPPGNAVAVPAVRFRIPSIAWTAAAAIGLAMVFTMALSLRTISSLKDTVGVLATENQQTVAVLLDQLAKSTGIRLASYTRSRTLNGTSWDIQLKPAFGAASTIAATDTLAFDRNGNRVTSGQLQQAGFSDAPFTAKRQDGGSVLWETFQVGPDGETVSWRGEWTGSVIRGVMARQRPGEPDATFRFIGIPHSGGREI